MQGFIFRICAVLSVLLPLHAWALASDVSLNDYHHQTWSRKDGAPANISDIAQTNDGWLWIGTEQGLYRFDGLRFEPYRSPSGRQLAGARITTLNGARNGDLLIGYMDGGIDLLRNGEIQALPSASAAQIDMVYNIQADHDGDIWVCTRTGVLRYANGNWQRIDQRWGLPHKIAESLSVDQYGQVWVMDDGAWYKLARKERRFVPAGGRGEEKPRYAPDGSMWRMKGGLLTRVSSDQAGPALPRPQGQQHLSSASRYLFDASGNLWLLSRQGLARVRHQDLPRSDSYDPELLPKEVWVPRGTPGNPHPDNMLEDREGNLWLAARGGLERFRHQRIRTIAVPEGSDRFTLLADPQGRIWAGAVNLDQLWDVAHAPAPPVIQGTRRITSPGRDGTLLTASPQGIERYLGARRIERIALPAVCTKALGPDVNQVAEDRDSLWAAIRTCGLFRYRDGVWRNATELGVAVGMRVYSPDRDGAMWIGYRDGRLQRYQDGKFSTYTLADGGAIAGLRMVDTQREVLISGSQGTAVLRDGRFHRLSSSDPAALVNLAGVAILPNGDRWLNTTLGMAQVRAADWQATLADTRLPLRMNILDAADGYPGAAMISTALSSAAIDAAGKLWFVGTEGIGVLDPAGEDRHTLPPTVQITGLTADHLRYAPQPALQLPPRPARLDIGFAAISLTRPERMQVWYKLEGADREWQAAGANRSASYANLGPGNYRFLLKAVNREGAWSERVATLPLSIQPGFTQTAWFYLLCAAGVAGLAYALYLLRMRQVVGRINALLGARLLERERIARALHDSWLQDVHGMVLGFAGVSDSLPLASPARVRMEHWLQRADRVLVDGRNAVMGLRAAAVQSDNVEQAFASLGARLQREHGVSYVQRLRGAVRPLDSAAWDEIYYVAYEALHNAYRHAAASRVTLTLDYGVDSFVMLVADDGKGMPQQVLLDGGRERHWGLTGMRERARMVDGDITLRSPNGRGTEICLRIPAARAYAAGTGAGRLARLRAWWRGLTTSRLS